MKRLAALIGLAWLTSALATIFRRPPRCKCGEPAVDDGLGFGSCKACERDEWEGPGSGPPTLRPVELQAKGIGQ
jgi:hypothetical protein